MADNHNRRVPLLQRYLTLQEEYYALKEVCSEQERTLEEFGGQLSAAKLAAAELREAADNAQQQQQSALQEGSVTWANDRLVTQCKGCNREFNVTRRKVIKLFNCSHAFVNPPPLSLALSFSLSLSLFLSLELPPQPRFLRLLRGITLRHSSRLPLSPIRSIRRTGSRDWKLRLKARRTVRNCSIIPAVLEITAFPRCGFQPTELAEETRRSGALNDHGRSCRDEVDRASLGIHLPKPGSDARAARSSDRQDLEIEIAPRAQQL